MTPMAYASARRPREEILAAAEGEGLGAGRFDDGLHLRRGRAIPDDQPGLDVVEDLAEVLQRHLDVEGVDDGAVAHDAEEQHDQLRAVVAEERDAITRPDAARGEEVAHAVAGAVQLREGQARARLEGFEVHALPTAPGVVREERVEGWESRAQIPRSAMNLA